MAALAAVIVSGGVAYAAVSTTHSAHAMPYATADLAAAALNPASVFLEADLTGRGVMPKSGQRSGDPRGQATVVLKITKNRIMYEITWQNMSAPTGVWLQQGTSGGMNLMPGALPGSIDAIAGVVDSSGARLLNLLLSNPEAFYANGTTLNFPAGAVRGQFRRIGPFDFNRILHVGQLISVDSGDQEAATGDPDAHATVFLGAGSATTLNYAATWSGVNSPTRLNVDNGAIGAVGSLVATLFAAPRGLNPTIIAVAGTVTVPARTVAAIKADPAAFHTNLVTARFPGGAARGQLFAAGAVTTTTMPRPTTTMQPTTTMPKPPTRTTKPTMTMPPGTSSMPSATPTNAPPHW